MPCYKAKSTHVSAPDTKPGSGNNWQTYWDVCPCCPTSSSVTTGGTTSSSSSSSSIVSTPAPTVVFAKSTGVPDWNQPFYYQGAHTAGLTAEGLHGTTTQIPAGTLSSPSAQGGNWAGLPANAFKAWCAPTAAATLHSYLQHGYTPYLGGGNNGINKPAWAGDNINAASSTNPALSTIPWNSAPAWGDYMLDGPAWRGKIASPDSVKGCRQTDFGWWMDTNGVGYNGTPNLVGTTLGKVYDGLLKFYGHLGYREPDSWIGMAYHLPHTGATLVTMGHNPYSNNNNSDLSSVWNAITNELDNDRPVIATTMGYELVELVSTDWIFNSNPNIDFEPKCRFHILNDNQSGSVRNVTFNAATVTDNGEEMDWEVYDANGVGHTVLIVGYIKAGSPDDYSSQVSGGYPATNWLVIRDNLSVSHRNVAIPFDQSLTGAKSLWDILLSTCYADPAVGATISSTGWPHDLCQTSSSSSLSGGGGGIAGSGACCTSSGSNCGVMTAAFCATYFSDGIYKGDGVPCGTYTCSDSPGGGSPG